MRSCVPRWIDLACLTAVAASACGEGNVLVPAAVEPEEDSIVGGKPFDGLPAVGALTWAGEPFCTATLIGPRTLVTAAHCLHEAEPERLAFAIGPDATRPEQSLPVVALRPHPAFDPYDLEHDLGLVTLAADAPVEPLPRLPAMDASWVGTDLFFVGYGVTNGTTGRGAGRKRAVWIAVSHVEPTTFEYDDPERNTCYGDSGGPAFHVDREGHHLLAGVTSWGDRRCTQFGVDTRLDAYRAFLDAALPPPPAAAPADDPPADDPPPADSPAPDPPADDAPPAGGQEIEGVSFTAAEAAAVLALVNNASEEELDDQVGLDSRAAANIVAARPFATLAELAAVPYVGPTALAKLKAYAGAA